MIWGPWLLFEQTEKRTTGLSFIPNIKTLYLVFSEKIYQKFIFHYILYSKTSKNTKFEFSKYSIIRNKFEYAGIRKRAYIYGLLY